MEKGKHRAEKGNVTFRMKKDQIKALDELGKCYDRDRSYLVNEAVEEYLARREWQLEEVKRALAEVTREIPDRRGIRGRHEDVAVTRLVWSNRFRNELNREVSYVRARNPVAAEMLRQRIVKSVRRLAQFPDAGRAWRLPGCRELMIPGLPYIVIYKVTVDEVVVAQLFHASREEPHVH